MLMIFYIAANFEVDASLFKITLIFVQMILRVNLVLIFTHLGHFFREWAKISTREKLNG